MCVALPLLPLVSALQCVHGANLPHMSGWAKHKGTTQTLRYSSSSYRGLPFKPVLAGGRGSGKGAPSPPPPPPCLFNFTVVQMVVSANDHSNEWALLGLRLTRMWAGSPLAWAVPAVPGGLAAPSVRFACMWAGGSAAGRPRD